jgi:two-component system, cell cycle sensor histidine kinase and response regulator CckA
MLNPPRCDAPVSKTPNCSRASELRHCGLFDSAELALRFTEFALEHASDGIFWAEPDGRFAYVNRAACSSLGYTRKELLAMRVFDIAPALEQEEWKTRWQELNSRGGLVYESNHRTRAGRALPIEITVNSVCCGGRQHAFGFVRDISALRAAQWALRARERRYREFIAHSGEAVWCIEFREPIPAGLPKEPRLRMIYRTGYISECNDASARFRGFSRSSELTGMALKEIVPPAEWRTIGHAVQDPERGTYEYVRQQPDGSSRHFVRTHTTIVEDGFVRQVWGTTLETTERRRAEDAFLESERRFRELLETVELVAVMLDAGGRVTFCNSHMLRVTGWSREEVLGQNWFDLCVPEQDRERLRAGFAAAIAASDLAGHQESSILTREGRCRLVAWDNTLLRNPAGQAVGAANLGRDVTDHRALEEQYRQAQKMESIGRLAGGVAHDFNNLLTVINAYSEFLLETLDESDPSRVNLIEIRKAGDRAAALTQQLLAFSRRQVLQPAVLDLNAIVGDAEKMLRRVIGEDIELITRLDPSLRPVRADAGQLNQALLNLAINARDAIQSGGKLTITTSNVQAGPEFPAGEAPCVLLTVADTGSGISAEDLPHIFEPFFTTKHPGKGTGLGLSTVYGIVHQSGGQILVESEPGQGSTFSVFLPGVDASVCAPASAAAAASTGRGTETVLVAEDETEVRAVAVQLLQSLGYRVLSASNGRDALALIDDSVQVVLTDVVMPEMSGRELAKHVRRTRPNIRVLFMSGYAYLDGDDEDFSRAGEAYLQKPFTPAVLAAKIREVLDASTA